MTVSNEALLGGIEQNLRDSTDEEWQEIWMLFAIEGGKYRASFKWVSSSGNSTDYKPDNIFLPMNAAADIYHNLIAEGDQFDVIMIKIARDDGAELFLQ